MSGRAHPATPPGPCAGFSVGVTADFRPTGAGGATSWGDIGLAELEDAGIGWRFLEDTGDRLGAADVAGLDAVLVGAPAVDAGTVEGTDRLRLVARFGVGYDQVDVGACTAAGVAVTITPDGARRPVAGAALAMVLALQHNLVVKDRLVRQGRWQDKTAWHGRGLSGACVGMVGLGNIGTETVALMRPFGVEVLAHDPRRSAEHAAAAGARLVPLEELLRSADVVVLTAALTPETHHMIDAAALALMKPTALLVNMARGPLVDTDALVAALASGTIAGAGLDVFEVEPLPADHPLTAMDTVVLAPHALSWTDEMALGNGRSAMAAVLAAAGWRAPAHLVDPAVLRHPRWLDGAASEADGR